MLVSSRVGTSLRLEYDWRKQKRGYGREISD